MHILVFVVELSLILVVIATEKGSPRASLKSFRDDYDSVAKACVAVGFVKDHCKSNKDRRNMVIAFEARIKEKVQTVNGGNFVIFGEVRRNEGGGYNAKNGVFIAPKSGVYVFDWTIVIRAKTNAYTILHLNGKRKAYNNCQNNRRINMSCSKLAIVRMKAGDKAWVNSFPDTSYIYNTSSFSGFML